MSCQLPVSCAYFSRNLTDNPSAIRSAAAKPCSVGRRPFLPVFIAATKTEAVCLICTSLV
ncbi:MAG: hypothetical protein B7Z18_02610 [Alishewanella sp. 32-51-5]|nr:MAG: hypothetical protein B7Z18_02610 [Alishewanella sp. 32-51-5]